MIVYKIIQIKLPRKYNVHDYIHMYDYITNHNLRITIYLLLLITMETLSFGAEKMRKMRSNLPDDPSGSETSNC